MRTRREYLDYYNSQVLPHVNILEKERKLFEAPEIKKGDLNVGELFNN